MTILQKCPSHESLRKMEETQLNAMWDLGLDSETENLFMLVEKQRAIK